MARVDVAPGNRRFPVTYDPSRITTARMLAALEQAREPATLVPVAALDVEFVEALERAQQQRPATLSATARIAPADEPGTPLVIHGRLFDEDGRTPMADAIVFAYHTDREGRYDRRGSPPHSWRLRGWAQPDGAGRFGFRTIRPGPYPARPEPAHVHLTVFTRWGRYSSALLFADDERVPASEREASQQAGDFGSVRPVRRDGPEEHVEMKLRLDARDRF